MKIRHRNIGLLDRRSRLLCSNSCPAGNTLSGNNPIRICSNRGDLTLVSICSSTSRTTSDGHVVVNLRSHGKNPASTHVYTCLICSMPRANNGLAGESPIPRTSAGGRVEPSLGFSCPSTSAKSHNRAMMAEEGRWTICIQEKLEAYGTNGNKAEDKDKDFPRYLQCPSAPYSCGNPLTHASKRLTLLLVIVMRCQIEKGSSYAVIGPDSFLGGS